LPSPAGSGPGVRRPVVVIQGDALNRSRIATAVCVPLTSNLRCSVANVSQIVAVDKSLLTECVGKVPRAKLELLLAGIDIVLGR
jgi:mRNA interferase MazF